MSNLIYDRRSNARDVTWTPDADVYQESLPSARCRRVVVRQTLFLFSTVILDDFITPHLDALARFITLPQSCMVSCSPSITKGVEIRHLDVVLVKL